MSRIFIANEGFFQQKRKERFFVQLIYTDETLATVNVSVVTLMF